MAANAFENNLLLRDKVFFVHPSTTIAPLIVLLD